MLGRDVALALQSCQRPERLVPQRILLVCSLLLVLLCLLAVFDVSAVSVISPPFSCFTVSPRKKYSFRSVILNALKSSSHATFCSQSLRVWVCLLISPVASVQKYRWILEAIPGYGGIAKMWNWRALWVEKMVSFSMFFFKEMCQLGGFFVHLIIVFHKVHFLLSSAAAASPHDTHEHTGSVAFPCTAAVQYQKRRITLPITLCKCWDYVFTTE